MFNKIGSIFVIFISYMFLSLSNVYGINWIPYDSNQKPILDQNKNSETIRYWKDISTSLLWTNGSKDKNVIITRNWKQAALYCINLNYSGVSSWRLPNKEEFYQAYQNGIFSLNNLSGIGNLDTSLFWTLTSTSIYNYYAWVIDLSLGKISPFIKNADLAVICVK